MGDDSNEITNKILSKNVIDSADISNLNFKSLGKDIPLIFGVALGNLFTISLLGVMGAAFSTLCAISQDKYEYPYLGKESKLRDIIFPTDPKSLPYECPASAQGDCSTPGFETNLDNNFSNILYNIVFGSIWSMNTYGFPYKNYFNNENNNMQNTTPYYITRWLRLSLIYSYIWYRKRWKDWLKIMDTLTNSVLWPIIYLFGFQWTTNIFINGPLFFGPLLIFYFMVLTPELENPWMMGLAGLIGFIVWNFAIVGCCCTSCTGCGALPFCGPAGFFFLFCILLSIIGSIWMNINGGVMAIYGALVQFFCPFAWPDGNALHVFKKQFLRRKRVLATIYIICTLSAIAGLATSGSVSSTLTGGICLAGFFIIYKIWRSQNWKPLDMDSYYPIQ